MVSVGKYEIEAGQIILYVPNAGGSPQQVYIAGIEDRTAKIRSVSVSDFNPLEEKTLSLDDISVMFIDACNVPLEKIEQLAKDNNRFGVPGLVQEYKP